MADHLDSEQVARFFSTSGTIAAAAEIINDPSAPEGLRDQALDVMLGGLSSITASDIQAGLRMLTTDEQIGNQEGIEG